MKIALIHLSDFHIRETDNNKINDQKINSVVNSLRAIKNIDNYILIVSGDISFSGKINEYKIAQKIISKLISGIKQNLTNKFVNVLTVPGNHDLTLPKDARDRKTIQKFYDDKKIEKLIPNEIEYLKNFRSFRYSPRNIENIFFTKKYINFSDYRIQFNLINTAIFSTLEPNDKELHYFPKNQLTSLKKENDCNLCITVMHHSHEWFNWNCKSELEKVLVNNSELLLNGHDHIGSTSSVSFNDSAFMCISSAGSIDFSCTNDNNDSFNAIILDTTQNKIFGYTFTWDSQNGIFTHKINLNNKKIEKRFGELHPLGSFIKTLKIDEFNFQNDFTKYFVCPKLEVKDFSPNSKVEIIENTKNLLDKILNFNQVGIIGDSNSGKTTLLKFIYISIMEKVVPIFWKLENNTKFHSHNLIKHLFEEQYGDDPILFEKFQQLSKSKKCLIIDNWDLIDKKINLEKMVSIIRDEFNTIIYSVSNYDIGLEQYIEDNIENNENKIMLEIKPFYKTKRNELINKICKLNGLKEESDITKINNKIDSIVINDMGLFSLNPAFILNYTKFFVELPLEYSSGEFVFSKVFEFELNRSVITYARKEDVDEIITKLEEIAGYMYDNLSEKLSMDEFAQIINTYNKEYGTKIDASTILDIGLQSKILKKDRNLMICFSNINHLAYFIAKYLIRDENNDKKSPKGISYALKNICFGLNSDIVLFISYILNDTKIINAIANKAKELLNNWESLNIQDHNLSILDINIPLDEINPPTNEDSEEYDKYVEQSEEIIDSNDNIETTGLFDFDENSVDDLPNKIIRSVKYSEILAKALSSFSSTMKLTQKRELVNFIYKFPKKIIYAVLKPIDENADTLCNEILESIIRKDKKKKNNENYTKQDIIMILSVYAQAIFLYFLNHFSELSTSTKSLELLLEKKTNDYCEQIERLLIIENSGRTDLLYSESLKIIKLNDDFMSLMVKLVVRKHLLINRNIPFSKKQKLIDKIFGKSRRKDFLLGK